MCGIGGCVVPPGGRPDRRALERMARALEHRGPDDEGIAIAGNVGLVLCRRIKRTLPPPRVLLYSAYADASLVIPAMLAGADGLVNKGAPAPELYDAVRTVARGDSVMPPVSRELLDAAQKRLDDEDIPVLMMALDGTPEGEIARTIGVTPEEMAHRLDRMIARLKVDVPAPRT